MARKVDYDRGVLIMTHPGTGMDVYMYVDTPGVYLNANELPVTDEIASEAGYKVEQLAKEKLRMQRKAQAGALIDKELSDETSTEEVEVADRNGFKIVSIGMGRHNVKDPDGNIINAHPLPLEMAQKLLSGMAGEEVKVTGKQK